MRKFLVAVVLTAVLASCTTTKILNVKDAPIAVTTGSNVEAAIEAGLQKRGWQVVARRPGEIDARLLVRMHRADINIAYDADSYSITYRDSENLDHRGDRIHRNYNRWIANLNTDIQAALSKPAS